MKIQKTLFYTLSGYVAINLAFVVNAQECQQIKAVTSQIVVANDAATLRKETDVDTGKETEGRPVIAKGDELTAINPGEEGSIKQKDNECWYKVESPENNQQPYWIEKQGIVPGVFQEVIASPSPSPPSSVKEPKIPPITNSKTNISQNWLTPNQLSIMAGVNLLLNLFSLAGLIFILGLLTSRSGFKKQINKIEKLEVNLETNQKKLEAISQELSKIKTNSEVGTQQMVDKIRSDLRKLASLINNKQMSYNQVDYTTSPQDTLDQSRQVPYHLDDSQSVDLPQASMTERINPNQYLPNTENLSSERLAYITECFNKNNTEYFRNEGFFFLKPTSATSLGSEGVGMNAMSIVEFEEVTENTSKSSYIGFNLENQKTYLIPNLFNNRWKQILQSDENKIFDVNGSDFLLVDAATIEGRRNGIWRLENSGNFQ